MQTLDSLARHERTKRVEWWTTSFANDVVELRRLENPCELYFNEQRMKLSLTLTVSV